MGEIRLEVISWTGDEYIVVINITGGII